MMCLADRPGLYKIAHSRKIQNEALPGHRFRCPEEVQMQNAGFLTRVVPQCLARRFFAAVASSPRRPRPPSAVFEDFCKEGFPRFVSVKKLGDID
jgi:hypothetical protein